MTRIQRPKKPFLWCPRCGIHNYWNTCGDHLECEDCRYVLPLSMVIRKSALPHKAVVLLPQKI